MTIDEYLNELQRLYCRAERKYRKLLDAKDNADSPRSSLNLGDGAPRGRSHVNTTERRTLKYVDASKEWRKALKERDDFKAALYDNIYQLYYWEALVIERIYVSSAYEGHTKNIISLTDILHTYNEDKLQAKLDEAKEHLRQILIEKGYDIE